MIRHASFLFGCLLLWPALAWGHASLLSASPAPGTILDKPPTTITLTFNEPVAVTVIRLFDPQGNQLPTNRIKGRHKILRIKVPPNKASGTYLLSWRIVSADGHPVGGTLNYAVGAPSARPSVSPASAATERDTFIWLFRWLGYLSLFAAIGAALFRALNPGVEVSWARWAVALGGLTLPVNLGLQGLDMLGAPGTALINTRIWGEAIGGPYFWTLLFMAYAFIAAAVALWTHQPVFARIAAPLAAVLTGVAVTSSGHASTAPPQWLARPMVAIHVLAAIAWIGALIPLFRLLRPRYRAGAISTLAPLSGFSRWITPVVVLLVLSGSTLAWLQLDHFSDFWRTEYGVVLLIKLVLVAVLLLVAASNRWRYTDGALAGSTRNQARLKRAIGFEITLAIIILAVVSVWRLTPPPRSVDATRAYQHMTVIHLENRKVTARLKKRDGSRTWNITLTTPEGRPFAAEGVTLVRSNPDAGIEPIRRKARYQSAGHWQVRFPSLPDVGHWQTKLEILIDDFDMTTLESPYDQHAHPSHSHGWMKTSGFFPSLGRSDDNPSRP